MLYLGLKGTRRRFRRVKTDGLRRTRPEIDFEYNGNLGTATNLPRISKTRNQNRLCPSQSVKVKCAFMWFDWFYSINSLRWLQLQLPVPLLWPHKFYGSAHRNALITPRASTKDLECYQIKRFSLVPAFVLLFSINFNLLFLHFINFRWDCCSRAFTAWKQNEISICQEGRKINYMRSLLPNCRAPRYNCLKALAPINDLWLPRAHVLMN